MEIIVVRVFIFLTLTFVGSDSFEWTAALPDCSVKYACVGDALTIPWTYTVAPGDTIVAVNWFFRAVSEQLMAIFTPPHFAPMPAFSNRLQRTSLAGIALSHVTTADTGNYSVRLTVSTDSGAVVKYNHTVVVQVMENDKLMTTDGALQARLEPQAIYRNTTGLWSLVLSCGNFTYLSDPPFNMEWETPSGAVVPSDGYTDGHFQLLVTSGGVYTCRIPQHAAADVCLHNASSHHATVHVDRMEARVTLMEARQEQLEKENEQLKQRETSIEARLDNKNSSLFQSLQNLTSKVSHQVAFTTTLHTGHTSNGTVIFDRVMNNYGNGYSSSTGNFTAPVAGLYFFMLTSSPETNNDNSHAEMYNDGSFLCYAGSNVGMPGKVASCGAAVHLSDGQRVYVTSGHNLTNYFTSFSGFLVNSD